MRWPSYVIVPTAKKKIIVINKVINLVAMVCSALSKYYGVVDL